MTFSQHSETMAPTFKGRSRDLPAQPSPNYDEARHEDAFEAFLYPNRSLPNGGFIAVMTIVISVNVLLGLTFTLMGAWPILVFGGPDVIFVWLAFKISYRQGRMHERIRITADEILVSRVLPSGHEMRWLLPTYWTRISIDEPVRHESQVTLSYQGKHLFVGAFLSPKERGALGATLRQQVSSFKA